MRMSLVQLWCLVGAICGLAAGLDVQQFSSFAALTQNEVENGPTIGQLMLYQGCSASQAPSCNLTCVFMADTSDENAFNTSWQSCLSKGSDVADVYSYPALDLGLIVTTVSIDPTKSNPFTCSSVANNATIDYHTFPITGNQSLPEVKNVTYVVSGVGTCEVHLTCKMASYPPPNLVLWLGISNGSVELLQVTNARYRSLLTDPKDPYVFPFVTWTDSSNSSSTYMCVAISELGIGFSQEIFPLIPPGPPVLNPLVVPLNGASSYDLSCNSSYGYPAPNITWQLLYSNADTGVILNSTLHVVDHGATVSTTKIDASLVTANKTVVRCIASNDYRDSTKTTSADVTFSQQDAPSIVYVKSCNSMEVLTSGCSLVLQVYSPKKAIIGAQWSYSALNQSSDIVLLYEVPPTNVSNGYFATSFPLTESDYRSGYYSCHVQMPDKQTLQYSFKVSEEQGKPLGGPCYDSTNCLALNSQCLNSKCACGAPYPVNDGTFSSTCTSESPEGAYCNHSFQCPSTVPLAYECRNHNCTCFGTYHNIAEEGGAKMCIYGVVVSFPCVYDEQCSMMDPDTFCDKSSAYSTGFCNCVYGYEFSTATLTCVDVYGYLSLSAAIAIAFGILLLLCIIFVAILSFAKSRRRRRMGASSGAQAVNDSSQVRTCQNVEWTEIDPTIRPYVPELPPSYGEISRSETPPPSFEDTVQFKFGDNNSASSALYLVNDNYYDDTEHHKYYEVALDDEKEPQTATNQAAQNDHEA